MTDILLKLSDTGADFSIKAGDLEMDESLQTGLLVSLFSDARATPDQLATADQDPRGWWPDNNRDRWGSLLWLLERKKATAASAEIARGYATAALEWLKLEDIVEKVTVVPSILAGGQLLLAISLTRGTATGWPSIWAAIREARFQVAGLGVLLLIRDP